MMIRWITERTSLQAPASMPTPAVVYSTVQNSRTLECLGFGLGLPG